MPWLIINHGMTDLHGTVSRYQTSALAHTLRRHPVVVLHGARQTGKTTLATLPEVSGDRAYLTLDDFETRDLAQRDPDALFIGRGHVTLDEVQREPDLLIAVKRAVDAGRRPGRFLLTGSANLLLMRRVSESLAGRAVYFQLPGLTWAEVEGREFGRNLAVLVRERSVEAVLCGLEPAPPPARPLSEAIMAGGYPVPSLSPDAGFRTRWFDGYMQTYLERDLREFSATGNLIDFRRLMQIAAGRNGALANMASLSRGAGLSPATARRYLGTLEVSFQLLRIPAYAVNRGKRLVKAPRLFWSDTGLAAHLAGIFDAGTLREGREWGAWLENWVCIHLLAFASLQTPRISLCHWRTAAGEEVDFVLESGRTPLPLEVKATARPRGDDARGLNAFLASYPEAPFGILACGCSEPHALSSRVLALPVADLLLG